MTPDIENLVLEHLSAIRATQTDHGERLSRVELRLSALEPTLGNICALAGRGRETVQSLTGAWSASNGGRI